MFTGIVEEVGEVLAREASSREPKATRLVFGASVVTAGTAPGDSISVNGCCLTVVDMGPGWWAAEAVAETLARTSLATLEPGDAVNLERAMALGGRFGGHLVQGHVDAVGHVVRSAPDLEVRAPMSVWRYLVEKGSVTVDGASLTIVSVTDDGFSVAVIPHTMGATTLGRRQPGDPVNLEVDVMAKYAERLLAAGAVSPYRSVTGLPEAGWPGVER